MKTKTFLMIIALLCAVAQGGWAQDSEQLEVGKTYAAGTTFNLGYSTYFTFGDAQGDGSAWKTSGKGIFTFVEDEQGWQIQCSTGLTYYINGNEQKGNNKKARFQAVGEPDSFTVVEGTGVFSDPFFFAINKAVNNMPLPRIEAVDTITGFNNPINIGRRKYFQFDGNTCFADGVDSFLIKKGNTGYELILPNNKVSLPIGKYDPVFLYPRIGDGSEKDPYLLTRGDKEYNVWRETFSPKAESASFCGELTIKGQENSLSGAACGTLPEGFILTQNTDYVGYATEVHIENLLNDRIVNLVCVVEGDGSIHAEADGKSIGTCTREGDILTIRNLNKNAFQLVPDDGVLFIKKITVQYIQTITKARFDFLSCAASYTAKDILVTPHAGCDESKGVLFLNNGDNIVITTTNGFPIGSVELAVSSDEGIDFSQIITSKAVKSSYNDGWMRFEDINDTALTVSYQTNAAGPAVSFSHALVTTAPDWNAPRLFELKAATGVSILASQTGMTFDPLKQLFDGNKSTKWCSSIKPNNPMKFGYVVFTPGVPYIMDHYTLTTGDDTKTNWHRNWKTWTLYGGSFEDDAAAAAAVSTSDGWKVIHHVQDDTSLPRENMADVTYSFSNTTAYQYYKLHVQEVVEARGENFQQMSEMAFEWPEDFTVTVTGFDGRYDDKAHDIQVTPSRNDIPGLQIRYSVDGLIYDQLISPTYISEGERMVYFHLTAPGFPELYGYAGVKITKNLQTGLEEIVNPQSTIGEAGSWYDLSGRKIANGQQPTAKGLYIKNGKKIIK